MPAPRKYRVSFDVTGSGRFPFDMLRYDACYPANSEGAVAMAYDDGAPVRTVTLHHYADAREWHPTERRWESFTWHVVPGSTVVEKL